MKVGKFAIRLAWAIAMSEESSIRNRTSTLRWNGSSMPVHRGGPPGGIGCSSSVWQAPRAAADRSAQPRARERIDTGRLEEPVDGRMFGLLFGGISRADRASEKNFSRRGPGPD